MTYWARGTLYIVLFGKIRCTFVPAKGFSVAASSHLPSEGVHHHSGKDMDEDNCPLKFILHTKNPHTEPPLKEAIIPSG